MHAPILELEIENHSAADIADEARYHAAAQWVAQRFQLKRLSASISVVDDPTIHRLNREHLDHDWPTDVISFVFENDGGEVDGEVIASVDTAARLALQAGWSTADELLLYIIHGLLHLAGMDDIEAEDRERMRAAESECLAALAVPAASHYLERWNSISY